MDPATDRRTNRRLATGLVALGLALAANSLLGPLVAGLVEYPFSETLVNQTIGLEAVSLLLVAPWCAAAAILVLRNHRAGPVLAVPPSAFTVYMFAQYVVGPQYSTYPPVVPFHLATFVLGGVVLVLAWNRTEVERLPASSRRGERTVAAVLVLLAGFTVSRYLPAVAGILTGAPIPEEFADDPTMYWSILLLDLGVVVPVTVAAGASLLRGATWARKAAYGIVGWFVLVPISVSVMGLVMLINDDPNASLATVIVLGAAALLFTAAAVRLHRPLFGRSGDDPDSRA